MLSLSWQKSTDHLVPVPAPLGRAIGYRDRVVHGLCQDANGPAGTPALFTHLTVNSLVSRLRAG